MSIAIIGGGVCGLSIGWYLARTGLGVTIFDKGKAGHGATWAAAGMLAACVEAEPGEDSLLPLLRESQARWPDFAREVEAASAMAIDYRNEGTLVVALTRDDGERLRFLFDHQRRLGLPVEWLTADAARGLEPHLAPRIAGAVFSPEDHQVDNRKLALALKAAFQKAGGELREECAVDEVVLEGGDGAVRGVRAGGDLHRAETVVLAAGAWSRNVPGLPEAARPPVRPVKGQMLALDMDPDFPLLRHVVWGPDIYLVPRGNRLLVGATVEEQAFDTRLTAGGLFDLLRHGWETLPGLYELPIAESWAGLRPTSRDDAPILGLGGVPGLVIATGHHRNGILLAPVTARAIADMVLTGAMADSVKPFAPSRFAA